MVSKAQIQFIRSLDRKKERDESGCFIVEGDKIVRELLRLPVESSFRIRNLFGLEIWLREQEHEIINKPDQVQMVSEAELERMSLMKTPNQALAIASKPEPSTRNFNFNSDLLIGLDHVQDPGNVGTLVRLADWFGLAGVVSSMDSADFFSPKVVQSSMGSIFRVHLLQTSLNSFLSDLPQGFPVYASSLAGTSIYKANLTRNGIILMGNESKGLTPSFQNLSVNDLLIPDFSVGAGKPESLNVSVAAAIICSEFRRR
ncbi:MAG: hypothetical protein A2X22_05520 [Bacteroidetes bacterium GWF2_49_14]|nr:MAG: hypothetical protein A2X22_05520 [Bacteroidetes bacterium GWF2_49_14]HBB90243.1 RNA methyltransferase [Bacteroidales bacterium]